MEPTNGAGPVSAGAENEAQKDRLASAITGEIKTKTKATQAAKRWRDVIPVHPAADLFPPMSETDPAALKELAEDIKRYCVQTPITVVHERTDGNEWSYYLLDGRNRLDAIELAGFDPISTPGRSLGGAHRRREGFDCGLDLHLGLLGEIAVQFIPPPDDPYAFVISANIHRRHLKAKQKREIVADLLKAQPEKSDLAISKITKTSDKTVTKVRKELEARSDIPNVSTRTDTKGRKQPTRKKPRRTKDDFKRNITKKKGTTIAIPGDIGRPVPMPVVEKVADPPTVVIPDELALLREFARFVLYRAQSVGNDPADHDEWKSLRDRVKAVLGTAS